MRMWQIVLSAIVITVGCAPSAKVYKERTLAADEVMRRVNERGQSISSLHGNGSITIETPEGSSSGSFDLSLKKPDSLLVELHGPFGIHVGTLLLSRERFLFYNNMDNTALVGKPDGRTLNSMFRLRMEFDEILRAFTGEFTSPATGDSLGSESIKDELYVIRYRTEQGTREYRVDGDTFVITSYRMLDSAGKSMLTAQTSDQEDVQGIMMPKFVRIIFPKERRAVTISYDDLTINEPVECSFTLPKHAEVIYR